MFVSYDQMEAKFDIVFLEEARSFIGSINEKAQRKILYNMDKARFLNDVSLLKKLTPEIWEFRTLYQGLQYRLLAFWDVKQKPTLVIATHGFVKKTDKVAREEIKKANSLRQLYIEQYT